MTIIEDLKAKAESWKDSILLRNSARMSAKQYLKEKQKELKQAKRVLYLTTKDWREARRQYKKAYSKLKSYPSQRRQWAKHNMDKVMELIEK